MYKKKKCMKCLGNDTTSKYFLYKCSGRLSGLHERKKLNYNKIKTKQKPLLRKYSQVFLLLFRQLQTRLYRSSHLLHRREKHFLSKGFFKVFD